MNSCPETRFLCDRMAGSLCKYLRFMGYDCTSANDMPPGNPREDTHILHTAETEGRFILTQDAELARRGGDQAIRLISSDLAGQIMQLVERGLIIPEIRLTRCSRCNTVLKAGTTPGNQNSIVPTDTPLMYCPVCSHQYWEGTHTKGMRTQLKQMLEKGEKIKSEIDIHS